LNNPSPFWFEELHANRKAVALQLMAVGYPGRGAKLTCARYKRQPLALFPAAETDHASAARTYVLCKSCFRAWKIAMAVKEYPDLHGDSPFGAVKRMESAKCHDCRSSSQARGNAREILDIVPGVTIFHAVERAIRGSQKLLRRVAIRRISRDTRADRKGGRFRFCCQALADPGYNACSDIRSGFGEYQGEFVTAVTRGRINGSGMIPQNLA
jgi:hypothetical protein